MADHWRDHGDGPGWWIVFPILFWGGLVTLVIFLRRRCRGQSGIRVLREAYARGEVGETDYRERLRVLRETSREKQK